MKLPVHEGGITIRNLQTLPGGPGVRSAAPRRRGPLRLLLWPKNWPFIFMHLACLMVLWTGMDLTGLLLIVGLYVARMFGITAGYHRYFSHRSYKTSRVFQFFLACLGCSSLQKGPLWWAAHHRDHHRYSDEEGDPHSPLHGGFWWSHIGWIMVPGSEARPAGVIPDFERYPELRWLDRWNWLPGVALMLACLAIDGLPGLAAFFISTVLLYHGTFTVNSLCHLFGRRRYATDDDSRNNALVALITLGEGWHNNHHHYQGSANQGFFWWELDLAYYGLWVLQAVGLVWGLRKPPPDKLAPELEMTPEPERSPEDDPFGFPESKIPVES